MCVETKPDPPPPVEPPIVIRPKLKDGGLGAPKILDYAEGRGPKPLWEAGPDDEIIDPP